jgi:arylsulfatase A-like enzyme
MKKIIPLLLLASSSLLSTAATQKPNIVIILADDLGYGDLTCYNKESKAPTPHLDRLAESGTRFTDGHSNSAVCTPSRYGIITGRYAWRTRLKRGVLMGFSGPLIDKKRETIASLAKKQGYKTACIGKWHLGLGWTKTDKKKNSIDYTKELTDSPLDHGFDYFYGIAASLDMPPYTWIENRKVTVIPTEKIKFNSGPLDFWRSGSRALGFELEQGLPITAKKSADYISQQTAKQPFLLYVALPSPHKPVLPSKEFKGKSKAGDYGDYVMETDWAVGLIMKALEKKKFTDNTLVIFTSDNGSFANIARYGVLKFGHNPCGVLRGGKTDIWEGGHRVPFIASWPAASKAGQTYKGTVSVTDIMATVADATHQKLDADAGVDSWSFYDVLTKNTSKNKDKARIFHSANGMFAIRKGQWKLIAGKGAGGRGGRGKKDDPAGQLYDIRQDISEQHNQFTQHPEIVKTLIKELSAIVEDGRSTPGEKQSNTGKTNFLPKNMK